MFHLKRLLENLTFENFPEYSMSVKSLPDTSGDEVAMGAGEEVEKTETSEINGQKKDLNALLIH